MQTNTCNHHHLDVLPTTQRSPNPWTVWRTQYFNDCRNKGVKPWQGTGLSPMTFASNVYHEMQTFAEAHDGDNWEHAESNIINVEDIGIDWASIDEYDDEMVLVVPRMAAEINLWNPREARV